MRVIHIDPETDSRWTPFVAGHSWASVYHTAAWKRVLGSTFPQVTPDYLALEDDGGSLCAALPLALVRSWLTGHRLVSLPFSAFCDPLANGDEDAEQLLEAARREAARHNARYLEIRSYHSAGRINGPDMTTNDYYRTFVLSLDDDMEGTYSRFHKGCIQRSIGKAIARGVTITVGESLADIVEYYEILTRWRRARGFPPQPVAFFKNMWRELHPEGLMSLLLARVEGRPVAGIILFRFGDTMYYEYGASEDDYLDYRPNHMLLWEGIQMAHREGRKSFDFGKTPPANAGLMDFKRRWGAEERDLPVIYYPKARGASSLKQEGLSYRLMRRAWQFAPTPVANAGGRFVYRHMG